jgi:hypothetical protein
MMAGKPSPAPNYHLARINQPWALRSPGTCGTGASRELMLIWIGCVWGLGGGPIHLTL